MFSLAGEVFGAFPAAGFWWSVANGAASEALGCATVDEGGVGGKEGGGRGVGERRREVMELW